MGTNYYVQLNKCKECGKCEKEIHLGKSSSGWQFSFQYNNGEYYKNVPEMKKWLKDKDIYNEYNEKVSYKDFWKMVKNKMKGKNHTKECPDDITSFNIKGYSFTNCEFC